jgi:hypothetical protein
LATANGPEPFLFFLDNQMGPFHRRAALITYARGLLHFQDAFC